MAPRVQNFMNERHFPLHSLTAKGAELRAKRPPAKVMVVAKEALTKQASQIAKKADEHEHFINKVTYCIGVVAFGLFCYLLGSRPQDIPYVYCAFFLIAAPLRWIYYRSKKWHYFLLDFCYYANTIFTAHLLFFPRSAKLFIVCFAFSEGPLAWALIVWRCSLVFSSIDKIVSVLIHLLPGTVIFIIRWWDPSTFTQHALDDTGPWPAWPHTESGQELWTWMFVVPLAAYSLWQMLYWAIVDGLRKQRLLNDPKVLTSYRELSRKAARANSMWWRISGVLGDHNRVVMYAVLQALFTVATMALTVPMFLSYRLHCFFQFFKVAAAIWNGGNFFFDVMPRQVHAKAEQKKEAKEMIKHQEARGPPETSSAKITPYPPASDFPCSEENQQTTEPREEGENGKTFCAYCRRASLSNLVELVDGNSVEAIGRNRSKSLSALPDSEGTTNVDEIEGCHEDSDGDEVWEEPNEGGDDDNNEWEREKEMEGAIVLKENDDGILGKYVQNTSVLFSNFLKRRQCNGQTRMGG